MSESNKEKSNQTHFCYLNLETNKERKGYEQKKMNGNIKNPHMGPFF